MEKWTPARYEQRLKEMKQDAHDKMWLYIEVNARDLLADCEPGTKNLNAACKGMLAQMLEGDVFIQEPKVRSRIAGTLTVRYYVDNLSPERRTWMEAAAQ